LCYKSIQCVKITRKKAKPKRLNTAASLKPKAESLKPKAESGIQLRVASCTLQARYSLKLKAESRKLNTAAGDIQQQAHSYNGEATSCLLIPNKRTKNLKPKT
jgi:hypothetical protein